MRTLAIVVLAILIAITAFAVPQEMNYQGKLTDPDGVAIEGTVNIRFSLWDAETGGSEVWFENRTVDVFHGLFDVNLGEVNPITLLFEGDLWLQLAVEGEVLDTRQSMTAVPHAFRAAVAESLAGGVIVEHNELTGIQGGTTDEYYHLTEIQHTQLHPPGSDNQNLFSSVTDGVDTYTASSETDGLRFVGTGGVDVTVDDVIGAITIDGASAGDNWGSQAVESDPSLTGDGTSATELGIATDGVNDTHIDWGLGADEVGAEDVPYDNTASGLTAADVQTAIDELDAAIAASGDGWGSQVAQTTARIDGDGTAGDPLDIAQQGATDGQALKWNSASTSWEPADDIDTDEQDLSLVGTNLNITDGAGVSLAGFMDNTDDQTDVEVPLTTLGDFTVVSGETEVHGALVDLDDAIVANQNDIATNTADIATNTADIATNTADIAGHIAADGDLDDTNELITAGSYTHGTHTLTITEAGADWDIDLSALDNAGSDDQTDVEVPLTSTVDFTVISGETEVHGALVDLDGAIVVNQNDIATNTADIATNTADIATNTGDIATNTADIAGHIAADGDLDDTNELQTIAGSGTSAFTLSDGGGTITLAGSGGASVSRTGNTLTIDASSAGDDWGSQVVQSDATLSGDGTAGTPLGVVWGNVTQHTDVTDAGSGAIITVAERANLHAPTSDNQNLFNRVSDGTNTYTVASQTDILNFTATGGAAVAVNPATGQVTIDASSAGDDWGSQTASTTTRLTGDGTAGDPLDIAQQGATSGQALKWNGSSWAPADDEEGTAGDYNHNSLSGLQGGTTGEYYHLTAAQEADLHAPESDNQFIDAGTGIVGGGSGATVDIDFDVTWGDMRYVNEGQANSITSTMIVDGTIGTADIGDGSILEADMDITNAPTGLDNYLLSFNEPGGNFTWVNPTTMGTDDQTDVEVPLTSTVDFTVITGETEVHGALVDLDDAIVVNQNDIATNTADIATNTADIATNTADIATNTGDIATNTADIAGHIAADGDLDDTNELITAGSYTHGTHTLTITEAGADWNIDLSALDNAGSDDQTDVEVPLTSTVDFTVITGETEVHGALVDLDDAIVVNQNDIATNTADIATNTGDIATNTADIAGHIAADGDLDDTNELQDLGFVNGGSTYGYFEHTVTITDGANATIRDYYDPDTDEQDLSLVGTNLNITDGTGVSLAGFMDNTDEQDLSYTASTRALGISGGTGVTLPLVTSTEDGLAPSSGGGTTNYLRADGTWAEPPGTASGTITEVVAGNGLTGGGTSGVVTLHANPDGSSIEIVSDALQVRALGIKDYHIDWGHGAGQVDADNVPFAPSTSGDWSMGVDPGDVDDALDQLANRVDGLEGGTGSVTSITGGTGISPAGPVSGAVDLSINTTELSLTGLSAPSATSLNVLYGTSANTAVEGNETATITAGTGLTGGISGDALGDGFSATLNVNFGGSGTATTASRSDHNHSTLTRGTGLTGSNYNGSSATTWAVNFGTTAGTVAEGNHTHAGTYDNYGSWNIQANGGASTDITTGETVNFAQGGLTTVSRSGNTITISSSGDGTGTDSQNLSYTASTRALGISGGSGVTLPLVTSTDAGLAPSSGGGTTNYLRADGTWATPPGTSSGDITAVNAGTGLSGGGTSGDVTLNLANTAVSAGSYTNANITVDAQGRLTAASSGSGAISGSGTAGYTARWTTSTSLGTSSIQDNGSGNIGINRVQSATYRLITENSSNAEARLAGNTWGVYGEGDGAGVYGQTGSGPPYTYGVLGHGSLGYGVYGSSPTVGVYGYGNGAGTSGVVGEGSTNGVRGVGTTTGVRGEGSSYGVYAQGGTYGLYATGTTYGVRSSGATYGVYSSGSSFDIYASNSSADNYFAGYVGINKTSPSQRLDVVGRVRFNDPSYIDTRYVEIYSSGANYIDGTNDLYIRPTGGLILQPGYNNTVEQGVQIKTRGGTQYGVFDGTTSRFGMIQEFSTPGSKLSIQGNASIGGLTYATTSAPTNGMIVEGNVGIGTSSPGALLHVEGRTANIGQSNSVSAPSGTWGANIAIGATHSITGGRGATVIGYGNSSSGDFGTILGVRNTISSSVSGGHVFGLDNTVSATDAVAIGSFVSNSIANSIQLGWNSSSGPGALTILSSGNVGIGTTSPNNKLEITHGTSGNSGLRFTNLTSGSTAGAAGTKVLSVDASGNVVLVTDATGGSSNWSRSGTQLSPLTSGDYVYVSVSSATQAIYGYNSYGSAGTHGVYGYQSTSTNATGYDINSSINGTAGYVLYGNNYHFGVNGRTWGSDSGTRTGGVLGTMVGYTVWGSLSYKNSSSNNYGAYWTSSGAGSGRPAPPRGGDDSAYDPGGVHINIGAGGYGDLFGLHAQGQIYGAYFEGGRYGLYTYGDRFSNGLDVHLTDVGEEDMAVSYTTTSVEAKISADGVDRLSDGSRRVEFDSEFKKLVDPAKRVTVTVTPLGCCNGVYLSEVDENGFTVVENNGGRSDIEFMWIAMARRIDARDKTALPREVVASDYTDKIGRGLHNDGDLRTDGEGLYFEGGELVVGVHPSALPNENLIALKEAYEKDPSSNSYEGWASAFGAEGVEMPFSRQEHQDRLNTIENHNEQPHKPGQAELPTPGPRDNIVKQPAERVY